MGCSDNAYLALGALFGCLPFVLFKSRRGLFQFLVNFSGLIYVVIALWLIYITIMIFDKKNQKAADETGAVPVRMWSGLLAACGFKNRPAFIISINKIILILHYQKSSCI